jgi:hypothetical protein
METKYKVVERNGNTIIRVIKDLNIFQAEETFFKILNTNPVRSGYNNIKIEKHKNK